VGDAAVFNAGVQGRNEVGHVAYVEEVAADGTLRLSEFNAIRERPYEFSDRSGQSAEGLVFIHKK
jgi:surface antigen